MKKLFSIILAIIMIMSLSVTSVLAVESTPEESGTWIIKDNYTNKTFCKIVLNHGVYSIDYFGTEVNEFGSYSVSSNVIKTDNGLSWIIIGDYLCSTTSIVSNVSINVSDEYVQFSKESDNKNFKVEYDGSGVYREYSSIDGYWMLTNSGNYHKFGNVIKIEGIGTHLYDYNTNKLYTSVAVRYNDHISVMIDDRELVFDTEPQSVNGRTMVPMRTIFEELGATVSWDQSTKTAIGVYGDTTVKITIGNTTAYKNNIPIELDSPAYTTDGRTMVPVRFIAESFNCNVEWNQNTKTVLITSPDSSNKYDSQINNYLNSKSNYNAIPYESVPSDNYSGYAYVYGCITIPENTKVYIMDFDMSNPNVVNYRFEVTNPNFIDRSKMTRYNQGGLVCDAVNAIMIIKVNKSSERTLDPITWKPIGPVVVTEYNQIVDIMYLN